MKLKCSLFGLGLRLGLVALLQSSCRQETYYPVPVPQYDREYILRSPQGRVTDPALVEAYPVARYVDPSNKNIMHEKHFVYRRQAPKWKLDSEPSERVVVGSVAGLYGGREKSRPSQVVVEDALVSQREQARKIDSVSRDVDQLKANQQALSTSQLKLLKGLQAAESREAKERESQNLQPANPNPPTQ
jgi:hypothetical protein